MKNYTFIITSFTFFLLSCESDDKIRTYRLPKKSNHSPLSNEESGSTIDRTQTKNVDLTLKWQKPVGWEQFDGHSMRMASFYVPHSSGKGELSITEFSGTSGGIKANINRWRGQISLPSESEQSILDASLSYKSKLGNFLFFELSNEKTNQGILASIFELQNRTIFVKLSIEQTALISVKNDFLTFSKSFSL